MNTKKIYLMIISKNQIVPILIFIYGEQTETVWNGHKNSMWKVDENESYVVQFLFEAKLSKEIAQKLHLVGTVIQNRSVNYTLR